MIQQLQFKRDFSQTLSRFEAWWRCEPIDRAIVQLSVAPSRPYAGPTSEHTSHHDRWMDVEFIVDQAVAQMARRDYVGDALPIFWPNLGPVITAALFGCDIEFAEDTSWSVPIVQDEAGWERIAKSTADFSNKYWRTVEWMTDYALQCCRDRFLVGITDLHGNYDILASLRGNEELCIDLLDAPDAVRRAGAVVARGFVQAFERSYNRLANAGQGSTCWTAFTHAGPAFIPSCDFWCMVSPKIAREMILPDILTEMQPMQRSVFHLDGPGALQHLDLLLEIPQLHAVQWVYGAGNGPAARWIDVYRRILQAGKSVQVLAEDGVDALAILDAVGSRGVWLSVAQSFAHRSSAEAFVVDVARYSRIG